MKIKKTISILLAMTMVASAVAGCSEKKTTDKKDNASVTEKEEEKKPEETTASESKPVATSAQDEEVEEVEEPEESESEIPSDFEIVGYSDEYLDKEEEILSKYASLDEAAYAIFNSKIDELHNENPDLRFQYTMYFTTEYPIYWGLCAGEAGSANGTLYLSD